MPVLRHNLTCSFSNSYQCYFQFFKSYCATFFLISVYAAFCNFLHASLSYSVFYLLFPPFFPLLLFSRFFFSPCLAPFSFSCLLSSPPALPPLHQLTWTCPTCPLTLTPSTWMLRSPLSSRVTLAPPRACQAASRPLRPTPTDCPSLRR